MCGVAGLYAYHSAAPGVSCGELQRTCVHMVVRGPDGSGMWCSKDGRVGSAHRHLAIIDLTARASQPMQTEDGRVIIVFNGGIYDYTEIEEYLESKGKVFRTNSDTEVLINLYLDKSVHMVHSLRGMFAFALWGCPRGKCITGP